MRRKRTINEAWLVESDVVAGLFLLFGFDLKRLRHTNMTIVINIMLLTMPRDICLSIDAPNWLAGNTGRDGSCKSTFHDPRVCELTCIDSLTDLRTSIATAVGYGVSGSAVLPQASMRLKRPIKNRLCVDHSCRRYTAGTVLQVPSSSLFKQARQLQGLSLSLPLS